MERTHDLTAPQLTYFFLQLPIEDQKQFLELCLAERNAVADRVESLKGTIRAMGLHWERDIKTLEGISKRYFSLLERLAKQPKEPTNIGFFTRDDSKLADGNYVFTMRSETE